MAGSATQFSFRALLTPRWIITTILVIVAAAVMVRLGFWQLDRLRQRRELNSAVEAQMAAPALNLNKQIPTSQLTGMEYRQVSVQGTYDPQDEILLRNQLSGDGQPGYHLLTPLRITGSAESVLVDRGFVPLEASQPGELARYAHPGTVNLSGVIRLGHVPRFFGVPDPALAPGQTRLGTWNAINIPRIASQTPYALLPVYIQAAPSAADPAMPQASIDQPDLTEGPHLGYAAQWFSFAGVLLLGYPFFVRRQILPRGKKKK